MFLLAHAGEEHSDSVEASRHVLEVSPIVTSLLIVIAASAVLFALYKITKNQHLVLLAALFLLLLIGIFSYSALPALSAAAITIGFVVVLALAFFNL